MPRPLAQRLTAMDPARASKACIALARKAREVAEETSATFEQPDVLAVIRRYAAARQKEIPCLDRAELARALRIQGGFLRLAAAGRLTRLHMSASERREARRAIIRTGAVDE